MMAFDGSTNPLLSSQDHRRLEPTTRTRGCGNAERSLAGEIGSYAIRRPNHLLEIVLRHRRAERHHTPRPRNTPSFNIPMTNRFSSFLSDAMTSR